MDWRALTQVKELGVLVTNCSCLVNDLSKVFNVYWDMGIESAVVPPSWPKEYSTNINSSSPILVEFNENYNLNAYLSVRTEFFTYSISMRIHFNAIFHSQSSPPPFSPSGRSQDVDAIVNVILNAEKFVHISVMDYMPLMIYAPKLR